jgi:hypothetical protein
MSRRKMLIVDMNDLLRWLSLKSWTWLPSRQIGDDDVQRVYYAECC